MKSNVLWQYAAYLFIFLILSGCKKDINQIKSEGLVGDEGLANSLIVTCIPNGIQFFKTESLSQPRSESLGMGLGNKVLFAYGIKKINLTSRVDIYNTSSDSWTHKILEEKKFAVAIAGAGTKIGIAGGGFLGPVFSDRVDLYDVSSDTWTVSNLSEARGNIAGVGYGGSLYFAGGVDATKLYKRIDVYSTLSNTWSRLSLSIARQDIAAAATDNTILFAGGTTGAGGVTGRVDIYNVTTGTWSMGSVSKARSNMVGAALGIIVIFGGGVNGSGQSSDIVDMYNTHTHTWSVSHKSNASSWIQSAVQGTKMFFSGAGNNSGLATVDVYDICEDSWSTLNLSDGRFGAGAGATDKKVLFGGGDIGNNLQQLEKTVDILSIGGLIEH
jgi:Galactose oxidase, central domain